YHVTVIILFFFFFQAEDGIRDFHVTGVQTCALPISNTTSAPEIARAAWGFPYLSERRKAGPVESSSSAIRISSEESIQWRLEVRSEERRVGKECRCGWAR